MLVFIVGVTILKLNSPIINIQTFKTHPTKAINAAVPNFTIFIFSMLFQIVNMS